MPSVMIKAEASPTLGGGHIFRCISLIKHFRRQGWHCHFLCTAQTMKTVPVLGEQGLDTTLADDVKPDPEIVGDAHYDLMIFDQYDIDAEYEKLWRNKADKILVIDDLADRPHDCDVLLDQNHYPDAAARYKGLVPEQTQLILGPEYALLRPSFADVRPMIKPRRSVGRIFVCFGATDPQDMTSLAIEALDGVGLPVDVVIGMNSPNYIKVKEMCEARPRVKLHPNAQEAEIIDLMCEADLAIGAGGTMSWERCTLGLPAIVVTIADNQLEITQNLADRNVVEYLGHVGSLDGAQIQDAVREFMKDNDMLHLMSKNAMAMCDGDGCERVYEAVAPQGGESGGVNEG